MTDFGADVPFAQAVDKLVEHYGVLLPESTVVRITEGHAKAMSECAPQASRWPKQPGVAAVIAQMDGGMVPTVEPDASQADRRRGKQLRWREAKICLAYRKGSRSLAYGGTLCGDVNDAGQELFRCAAAVGFGRKTKVHAVGDGAEWIAAQVERKFGSNGTYLVDFYHVCEYLAAASKSIVRDDAGARCWLDKQSHRLKAGDVSNVLAALQPHLEPPERADEDAPVRQCHRYLSRRLDQLNYKDAVAQNLPIGSGDIESAHRHIVQQRLKRPGAWWLVEHAHQMLGLRINRANQQWESYWSTNARAA